MHLSSPVHLFCPRHSSFSSSDWLLNNNPCLLLPQPALPSFLPHQNSTTTLPLEQAIDLVKDAFVSAGERDIYTVSGQMRAEAHWLSDICGALRSLVLLL